MPIRKSSFSGSGGSDFLLSVGSSGDTTYVLGQAYPAGSYNISTNSDTTYDIYAIASDGTSAGYSNSSKIEASAAFTELVVLGAAAGEIFTFEYSGTVTAPSSKGDVASAGAFITSVSVSSLPTLDDTTTITGGNFAADVQVFFTGQDSVELEAKSLTRNSSTELVATRPDALDGTDSPYTVKVVNPGIIEPTGTSAHLLSNSITAGANPSWVTAAAQEYDPREAVSITLSATDADGTVSYSVQSGTLPGGLSLNGSTGEISGTPTTSEGDVNVFTIRATDEGGNFVDREFTFSSFAGIAATGGAVTEVGGYRYHTFTSSGTFSVSSAPGSSPSVEYLVVAGGGGGGRDSFSANRGAGGGGAGGYLSGTSTVSVQNYTITIGAGGIGGTGTADVPAINGQNGSDSSFGLIAQATGGGGGQGHPDGTGPDTPAGDGGSGGGASNGLLGGSGIPGQGNDGGDGAGPPYDGGGGGGAGAAGADTTGGALGDGGAGLQWLNGTYYAGGGGGRGGGGNASGGIGGGGNGGGNSGTANTGGGGGANRNADGASGGSGIVIVRYLI